MEYGPSKIKLNQVPKNWPWPKHETLNLSESQLEIIDNALKKVNPVLMEKIDGIYFLNRPKDFSSMSTETSFYENQIIVYKKAFDNKDDLASKIVHEFGHFLHEALEKNNFDDYNKKFSIKGRRYLTDSKLDMHEDFATNFEIFITKPVLLKKELPSIHDWFNKKFDDKYNLRECH